MTKDISFLARKSPKPVSGQVKHPIPLNSVHYMFYVTLSRYIALSNKRASVHGDHFPLHQNTACSVYSQRNPIQVASLRDYMTIQVASFGFTDMFYKSSKSHINSVCASELYGNRQKAGGEKMWMIRDGNTGQARYRASILLRLHDW